jgi:hypothetical protein
MGHDIGQNLAATPAVGVVELKMLGLLFPPRWFMMDFLAAQANTRTTNNIR